MKSPLSTDGISPVVGVILMVGITVILSAAVGMFVLSTTDSTGRTVSAGVDVTTDNQTQSVTVEAIDMGTAQNLTIEIVERPDGNRTAPTTTMDTVGTRTVSRLEPGDEIVVYGEADGERTVVATHTYSGNASPITASYDANLQSRWLLNAETGTVGVDDAYGRDLTLHNMTWASDGVTGDQSAHLPGNTTRRYGFRDDFHEKFDSQASQGAFVVSYKQIDETGGNVLVAQGYHNSTDGQDSSTQWNFAHDANGGLGLSVYQGNDLDANTSLALNEWHTVVVTWDGNGRRIYANGKLVAQDNQTQLNGVRTAYDFYIGMHPWAIKNDHVAPPVRIDEVRTYDRSLSQSEAQTLTNQTDARLG